MKMKRLLCTFLTAALISGNVFGAGFLNVQADDIVVNDFEQPATETDTETNRTEMLVQTEENTDLRKLETKINYALNGTATAKGEYAPNGWLASKAIDGISNRDETDKKKMSKWSHDGVMESWLQVDLKELKTIDEFKIAWESDAYTASLFHIDVSEDGINYQTIYTSPDKAEGLGADSDVKLDSPVQARYVKLVVDKMKDTPWPNVSVFEFQILGAVQMDNLSINASISSNGDEAASFPASKANDGSLDTRWASSLEHTEKWLALDFGESKQVSSAAVEWERLNASSYSIQSSSDGVQWTDVKSFSTIPSEFRDIINFDSPITARYLRLYIQAFNDSGLKRDGTTESWSNVSVLEFETYPEKLAPPENPLEKLIPTYNPSTGKIDIPELPGYSITNNGADFEQIVGDDFSVHQPLTDKEVKFSLNIKNAATGEEQLSKEFSLTIPGVFPDSTGNSKPQVIPEISEWHSDSVENFILTDSSRIVISSADLNMTAEEFQKDLTSVTGKTLDIVTGTRESLSPGDFFFTLDTTDTLMGEEGYHMIIGDTVQTDALHTKGAYWSTRTILQTLKLGSDGCSMPQGEMRDYPKYTVRGFVLDVGRKPFSMDTLKNIVKNMAWYKMNDFQVHLSDNYIFLEDYKNAGSPNPADALNAYSGFRLESSITNDQGASLASDDYHYSKAEFKSFIQDSRNLGVNIVPEMDVPAHALAITEVFPEFAVNGWNPRIGDRSLIDHLDISKQEVIDFSKTIFDDYTLDGTFDSETVVHVGADEFEAGASSYRNFINQIIPHVKQTNTVRFWGGLTWIKDNPITEIIPEAIEDVQINLWSNSWADGIEMYKMGYDLINTLDRFMYMVPDGSGSKGQYADYLNKNDIYNNFAPNKLLKANNQFQEVPAGDKQMLGGAFAIWQDNIDKRASGLSEEDIFTRFLDSLPLLSEKTWANGQEKGSTANIDTLADILSTAPNSNPYSEETAVSDVYADYTFGQDILKDSTENNRTLENPVNVSFPKTLNGHVLQLNGKESYIETPIDQLGSQGNILSFTLKLNEVQPGQILFEEDSAYGTSDIRITENGKLGFTRELYDYEFDYTLQPDTLMEISILALPQKTVLYVNGTFVSSAVGQFVNKGIVKKAGITNSSFALPLERIGSKTNAINGIIDNITIKKGTEIMTPGKISNQELSVSCDNQQALTGNVEGPISLAFDGNPDTFWHTQYSPSVIGLPAVIDIDMGKEYPLNKIVYVPRPGSSSGSVNGIITDYKIEVSIDNVDYKEVKTGNLEADKTEKIIEFETTNARYVRFTVQNGVGGFGSAAEFMLYQTDPKSELSILLSSIDTLWEDDYTTDSWKILQQANADARKIMEDTNASAEQISNAQAAVNSARNSLIKKSDVPPVDPVVNKTALQTLYDTYSKMDEARYTPESWKTFRETLNRAKVILDNSKATQDEVNQGADALKKAAASLKEKPPVVTPAVDKTALKTLYNSCKSLKESTYTTTTWKKFVSAYKNAASVINNSKATKSMVDSSLKSLTKAKKELVKKPALPKKGKTYKVGSYRYKVTASTTKTKTVTVTAPVKKTYKSVSIPSTVKINTYTYKVTAISDKAFKNNRRLEKVKIGNYVSSIGKECFLGCSKLKNIQISSTGIKKIGRYAFKNVNVKAKIYVPKKKYTSYKKLLNSSKISKQIKIIKK